MTQAAEEVLNQFPNLIELIGRLGLIQGSKLWTGPTIGSDDTPDLSAIGSDDLSDGGGVEVIGQDDVETVSDSRLKTDIAQVGKTVYGLPLYNFKYIGKPEVYEGVMAQDVLKVMPSAVLRGADGYYRVKYKDLGIQMRRVA